MISVWVSPSAGEVVAAAAIVEVVADTDPVVNITVGVDVRVTPSVVSVAVTVTDSATVSVNGERHLAVRSGRRRGRCDR